MISRLIAALVIGLFSLPALADQSYYCPQNHGYINTGMSQAQVISACGQPLSKQPATRPLTQRVPVQQLIYNSKGAPTAFYGVWSLPVGINTGVELDIDIIDNKVSSVRVNGSDTNAFSICQGTSIQIGDPVGAVYGACGNPAMVNRTFINQPIISNFKPEIWIYQPSPYQSPINLTFVNGKLQSID